MGSLAGPHHATTAHLMGYAATHACQAGNRTRTHRHHPNTHQHSPASRHLPHARRRGPGRAHPARRRAGLAGAHARQALHACTATGTCTRQAAVAHHQPVPPFNHYRQGPGRAHPAESKPKKGASLGAQPAPLHKWWTPRVVPSGSTTRTLTRTPHRRAHPHPTASVAAPPTAFPPRAWAPPHPIPCGKNWPGAEVSCRCRLRQCPPPRCPLTVAMIPGGPQAR